MDLREETTALLPKEAAGCENEGDHSEAATPPKGSDESDEDGGTVRPWGGCGRRSLGALLSILSSAIFSTTGVLIQCYRIIPLEQLIIRGVLKVKKK